MSVNLIAEVALAHDGSLGNAHAYVDAIARAGATTVKFQCQVGSPVTEFRPGAKPFPQDENRQAYYRRTSFTPQQWSELADHAHDAGLGFCVSVFSKEAIDYLENVAVGYWKIGSGQVGNLPLVTALAGRWAPLIISSGMSDWKELDAAVEVAMDVEKKSHGLRPSPMVMQCCSEYPCKPQHAGLNLIPELKRRYPGVSIGYSDHTGRVVTGTQAVAYGAEFLEFHVTWSKECFGPDVSASITIEELSQLVSDVRYIEQMEPVDKDKMAEGMKDMRKVFCVY